MDDYVYFFNPGGVRQPGDVPVRVFGSHFECRWISGTSVCRHRVLTVTLEMQPFPVKGHAMGISETGTQSNSWKYVIQPL